MQIKRLLILILFVPFLVHAQYNNWLDFTNWLTKESEYKFSVPVALWRADYGITTVDTGGTYPTVSNWLSTNGLYDAYQPTASKRPLYNGDSPALKFDNVDDGLQCNDGGVFNPGTGDFSAFAWVYIPYEDVTTDKFILCKGSGYSTAARGWRFFIYKIETAVNKITFVYSMSSSNYVLLNAFAYFYNFTTGGWFHVGVVADRDDTYSFYLNGSKLNSADISAYASENVQSGLYFKIGERNDGLYNYHSFIAEARYYNIALTESEIQALYNAGRPQGSMASEDNKTFNYVFNFLLR